MPAGPLILRCPTPAVGRVAPLHRMLGILLSAPAPELRGSTPIAEIWGRAASPNTPGHPARVGSYTSSATSNSYPPRADAT